MISEQDSYLISKLSLLYKDSILSLFHYGGQVYGVGTVNSDYDYVAVINSEKELPHYETVFDNVKLDVNIYNKRSFENMVIDHEITALECLFLPEYDALLSYCKYPFALSLPKLRQSISEKSSHSFVKARKKVRFGEYYIGKKSLWHSFRIIIFGIQIAKYGKIVDYRAANYLYKDIVLNESNDEEYYKNKYLSLHNNLMTEFRKLAPKDV